MTKGEVILCLVICAICAFIFGTQFTLGAFSYFPGSNDLKKNETSNVTTDHFAQQGRNEGDKDKSSIFCDPTESDAKATSFCDKDLHLVYLIIGISFFAVGILCCCLIFYQLLKTCKQSCEAVNVYTHV